MEGQWVVGLETVGPERTQGDVNRPSMPVAAVGVGDKPELIDARDESAEDQQIDKGDKSGGTPRGRQSDHGINSPEDSNNADDEQDQDVRRGQLVCFEVSIDEEGLVEGLGDDLDRSAAWTYQHANDGDQKGDLHQAIEDEEHASNHLDVWEGDRGKECNSGRFQECRRLQDHHVAACRDMGI